MTKGKFTSVCFIFRTFIVNGNNNPNILSGNVKLYVCDAFTR